MFPPYLRAPKDEGEREKGKWIQRFWHSGKTLLAIFTLQKNRRLNINVRRVCSLQCDQVWRNFATLAKSEKSLAKFSEFI